MPYGHICHFMINEKLGGYLMRYCVCSIAALFIILISLSGCKSAPTPLPTAQHAATPQTVPTAQTTTSKHSARLIKGEYDNIHIPAYIEYEPISLIFTTTEEYDNIDSPFLTYLSLLRKAHELGGHAIVNVSIEENKSCVKTESSVGPYEKGDTVCKYRRFGAALAVKYTKPITDVSALHAPVTPQIAPAPQPETAPVVNTQEHTQSNTGLLGKIF